MNIPTRLARCALRLLAAPLLTLAPPAHADVAFTTFGPGQTYSLPTFNPLISGSDFFAGYDSWADEFVPAFSGTMTGADFLLVDPDNGGSGLVTVALFLNNPLTNTPLVSSEVVLGNVTAASTQDYAVVPLTLNSTTVVPLVAGASYWIGLLPGDTSTQVLWGQAGDGSATSAANSDDGGMSYIASNPTASYFDVNATPGVPPIVPVIPAAPEPSTWAMLLSGAGLLGWQCRRLANRTN